MNYIIVDLEATCEHNNQDFDKETIEIGAVKVNEDLQIIDTFEFFIRPIMNPILSDYCKETTTISQEEVDNAPLFSEAIRAFKKWVQDDDYLILSWGNFDKSQLKKDCLRHKMEYNWIVLKHVNLKKQHAQKVLGWKNKKGMGMKRALEKANLPLIGVHHRGIDDAKNIASLFIHHFEQLEISQW